MRLLDSDDVSAVMDLLFEAFPREVLGVVARGGGSREQQIVSQLLRWLPSTGKAPEVRSWVSNSLDWFVARGDIVRGFGGRYHCVPPYLMDSPADPGFLAFGHPGCEQSVREALRPLRAVVIGRPVPHRGSGSADKGPPDQIPPVGWDRKIGCQPEVKEEVARRCKRVGVVVVNPDALAGALPAIEDALAPSERDLSAGRRGPGFWEEYAVVGSGNGRWVRRDDWRSRRARLVRWRPSEDWRGERNAQVFYHAGEGRVAELGPRAAAIWQLYLDAEAGRPRAIWWDRRRLWVPRTLPLATQHWLLLLSERSADFHGPWMVLGMRGKAAKTAIDMLRQTLRLVLMEGEPRDTEGEVVRSKGSGAP